VPERRKKSLRVKRFIGSSSAGRASMCARVDPRA